MDLKASFHEAIPWRLHTCSGTGNTSSASVTSWESVYKVFKSGKIRVDESVSRATGEKIITQCMQWGARPAQPHRPSRAIQNGVLSWVAGEWVTAELFEHTKVRGKEKTPIGVVRIWRSHAGITRWDSAASPSDPSAWYQQVISLRALRDSGCFLIAPMQ